MNLEDNCLSSFHIVNVDFCEQKGKVKLLFSIYKSSVVKIEAHHFVPFYYILWLLLDL